MEDKHKMMYIICIRKAIGMDSGDLAAAAMSWKNVLQKVFIFSLLDKFSQIPLTYIWVYVYILWKNFIFNFLKMFTQKLFDENWSGTRRDGVLSSAKELIWQFLSKIKWNRLELLLAQASIIWGWNRRTHLINFLTICLSLFNSTPAGRVAMMAIRISNKSVKRLGIISSFVQPMNSPWAYQNVARRFIITSSHM